MSGKREYEHLDDMVFCNSLALCSRSNGYGSIPRQPVNAANKFEYVVENTATVALRNCLNEDCNIIVLYERSYYDDDVVSTKTRCIERKIMKGESVILRVNNTTNFPHVHISVLGYK